LRGHFEAEEKRGKGEKGTENGKGMKGTDWMEETPNKNKFLHGYARTFIDCV